jgi:hypothetical protein
MARARNIKPGFFKNYELADLGPLAQLLFAGLWCLADKEGRLEDKPRFIKAEVFPYYDVDVNGELTKLEQLGFVVRYEAQGMKLIEVSNFKEHQSPHHTEKASVLPGRVAEKPELARAPGDNGELTVNPPKQDGGNPPDSLIHRFTDSLIPETTTSSSAGADLACPIEKLVAAYHELMPLNPRVKVLNEQRRKAIRARWLEASKLECKPFGYKTQAEGIEAWRAFFGVCAESLFLTGRARPQPGKPPFIADLDFLVSPQGFAKCLENKYHREAA